MARIFTSTNWSCLKKAPARSHRGLRSGLGGAVSRQARWHPRRHRVLFAAELETSHLRRRRCGGFQPRTVRPAAAGLRRQGTRQARNERAVRCVRDQTTHERTAGRRRPARAHRGSPVANKSWWKPATVIKKTREQSRPRLHPRVQLIRLSGCVPDSGITDLLLDWRSDVDARPESQCLQSAKHPETLECAPRWTFPIWRQPLIRRIRSKIDMRS